MAINKPVKKGTNQRVSQAKGLVDKVGTYGNKKSLNLTKKQLGASGAKAASKDKIAISRTTYNTTTKKVTGPMGKPITGRVDMGGGNIAVYKQGVRVKAASAKPKGGNGGGGGGGNGGGGGGYVMPKRDATKAGQGTPMRPVPDRKKKPIVGPARESPKSIPGRTTSPPSSAGGNYSPKAGGRGPTGTPIQQKIARLRNAISAAQSAYNASAKRAARDDAYRAQAKKDLQALQVLQNQLSAYK